VLLGRTGRMQEAKRELDAAIATYSDGRKPGGTLLRMLHWRGLLHLTEGSPGARQIDCEQARLLGQALGLDASVTIATHNIGLAKFYGGDLPGALAEMAKAEEVAPEVRVGFRALAGPGCCSLPDCPPKPGSSRTRHSAPSRPKGRGSISPRHCWCRPR